MNYNYTLGNVKHFPLSRGDNPTVLWNKSISGLSKILAHSSNLFEIWKVITVVLKVIIRYLINKYFLRPALN